MCDGVIVGRIVDASGGRLRLVDGTEFAISGRLAGPNLTPGTSVKVVYQVVDGLKIPVSITVLPKPW